MAWTSSTVAAKLLRFFYTPDKRDAPFGKKHSSFPHRDFEYLCRRAIPVFTLLYFGRLRAGSV